MPSICYFVKLWTKLNFLEGSLRKFPKLNFIKIRPTACDSFNAGR